MLSISLTFVSGQGNFFHIRVWFNSFPNSVLPVRIACALQWQELFRAGCFQHLLSHWDGAHLIRIASSGRLATALATAEAAAAAEDGIPALKQGNLGCDS